MLLDSKYKLWLFVYCSAVVVAVSPATAQEIRLRPAFPAEIPATIDSNTSLLWRGGELQLFSSAGAPRITTFGEPNVQSEVAIDSDEHFPMWIESVWQDADGTVYAWYHYERVGVCPGSDMHSPEIGALVSEDGGRSFRDLGIVLSSGDGNDCSSQNGYFAGGHGDFSVVRSPDGAYFYFLFGNYGGPVASQGVAIARLAAEDLASPVGAVWKYHAGQWSEPGLGGALTPIFPAVVGWQEEATDSFWGPSVHWNSYLQKYVVMMNRSCCAPGWPQEGIYWTTTPDLSDPQSWTTPAKILDRNDWYPWVWGMGLGETTSEAGRTVRLWVRNYSEWEIDFLRGDENEAPPEP